MRKTKAAAEGEGEEQPEGGSGGRFVPGDKPSPGRPRGPLSRRAVDERLGVQEVMDRLGYDPVAAMIDEAALKPDRDRRVAIHKALLPYVYSQQPREAVPVGEDEAWSRELRLAAPFGGLMIVERAREKTMRGRFKPIAGGAFAPYADREGHDLPAGFADFPHPDTIK